MARPRKRPIAGSKEKDTVHVITTERGGAFTAPPRLLIDTNVFLEILLGQERARECLALMRGLERGTVHAYMTSFSLHSIEVMLGRLHKLDELARFLDAISAAEGLTVYPSSPWEERDAVDAMRAFTLDFDDALQYTVARALHLELVSFDRDFDRTDVKRLVPVEILGPKAA